MSSPSPLSPPLKGGEFLNNLLKRRTGFHIVSASLLIGFIFAFQSASKELVFKVEQKPAPMVQAQLMRAVQVNTLEFENLPQLADWLKKLKAAGVNTVIVRVFHNPGDGFHKLCIPQAQSGVYFQTSSAPVVCDLTTITAQEAHKAGLKFYAWMNTRSADYGWETRTDLHSWSYDLESGNYQIQNRLCLFHPEVRARLLNLYSDLAQYPIDGVLVQDDLMLRHNEDFHPLAIHLYFQDRAKPAAPDLFYSVIDPAERGTGKKHVKDYTPEFWEWNEWKIGKLLDLADELGKAVKRKRLGAGFGLNFYYETALKPDKGKAWFSQDLKRASERNYDFYSLMLYHRQIREELRISDAELDSALELAGKNFLTLISSPGAPVIKLMTKDFHNSDLIPEVELTRVIQVIPDQSRAGLVFFSASPGQEAEIKNLILIWEKKNEDQKTERSSGKPSPSGNLQKPQP